MDIKTRRMAMSFPIIGQIRKGAAKQTAKRADGSTYQTVGADLGDKFRVVFFPGHDGADAVFYKEYGTFSPQRIKAMLPFATIDESWQYWNEAYTAGRMVAQADDDHYIMLRNPKSGVYEVKNGEPHTTYIPGDKVTYTQDNGKVVSLPIKPTGRLRLWLPVFKRWVMMELRTTSFYDCQNISNQLAAIEAMGNTLNHGNVAGIPIWIYRRPTDITWNKPDGSATRVEKWLINVEIDAEWVEYAMQRMRATAFGLSSGSAAPALPERVVIEGTSIDPAADDAGNEDDIPDEVIQAGQIHLGQREMSSMTNDELMLLTENPRAAQAIRTAAGLIVNWRIEHEKGE